MFASGVDTDLDTVDLGLFHRSVFEADGEGGVPGHHGPAFVQEFACSGGVAGLEWCVVFVEDEDGWVPLTRLLPNLGLGGDATDIRWDVGGLPSHMFRTGYHPWVVSESRFVPDPGRVY